MRRTILRIQWSVPGLVILVAGVHVGEAQEVRGPEIVVDATRPDSSIRIAVTPEQTLGDDDGPGSLTWGHVYSRDSRGRFYVVDAIAGGVVTVFDARGGLLQTVGRQGEGPGEYRFIVGLLVGEGDSIYVLDGPNQRLTVLNADYGVVRTAPAHVKPVTGQWARISHGRFLINGVIASQSRYGYAFHVLRGTDGSVERSFGLPHVPLTPGNQEAILARRLTTTDTSLYAAYRQQFAVEEWSLGGNHLRTLRRDVDWFPSYGGPLGVLTPKEPPKPFVVDIHHRSDGFLWVAIRVPDDQWRAGLQDVATADGTVSEPRSPHLVYDTRIELWDTRTATVVTSTVIDQAVVHFLDHDHVVAERREEETGVQRQELYHIHVTKH